MESYFTRLAFLCLFLFDFHRVSAQVTDAVLQGTVRDKATAMPGASLLLRHTATGEQRGVFADANGRFRFAGLNPGGPYLLTVSLTGFDTVRTEGFFLPLGQTRTVEIVLSESLNSLREVTITASKSSILKGKNLGPSYNFDEEMNDAPTLSRSIPDIVRYTPQGNRNAFAGANYRYNNLNIDGVGTNDAFGFQEPTVGAGGSTAAGTPGALARSQPISLDAISEIQVLLSPFDVKVGNFTGASINAVTKSGTNDWRGGLYTFGRNQRFTGRSPDAQRIRTEDFFDFQAGASLGGPIRRDKVFFFANIDWADRLEPVVFSPGTPGVVVKQEDAQALSDTLRSRYGYDAGSFGDERTRTRNYKIFSRLDWNLSARSHLLARLNYVDAFAENFSRSPNLLNYESQAFRHDSRSFNAAMELKTQVSDRLSNNLIIGYGRIHDTRTPYSALFPHIEITYNTEATIFVGEYREAAIFQMKQHSFELTDNLSWSKGRHLLTFGAHNEFYQFDYHFVTPFTGRWAYRSLADFYAQRPSRVRGTYNLTDASYAYNYNRPSADFDVLLSALYAQDEISFSNGLKLQAGLRADATFFLTKTNLDSDVSDDPAFAEFTGSIRPQVSPAPRFGFFWALGARKNLSLRGGTGLFNGRIPFAWTAYQYIYNGRQFGNIDLRPSGAVPLITNNFGQLEALQPGLREINLVDKNFRLPSNWNTTLAIEQALPGGWAAGGEMIFSKTLQDVFFQTINLKDSTRALQGADKRPIYQGNTAQQKVNARFTNVFAVSNTAKGYRWSASFFVEKKIAQKLEWRVAYTYGVSRDMVNGVRVSPQANWEWNQIVLPNAPALSYSNFDLRHRAQSSLSWSQKWQKGGKSQVFLAFFAQSGAPFSYVYAGDLNRDGSPTNDLIFVPSNATDIQLADIKDASGNVQASAAQQWEALDQYIQNAPYLRNHRGKYVERNGGRTPWNNQADLRISHAWSSHGHQFTLLLDVLNVTHLLHQGWGRQYFVPNTTNAGYSLLRLKSVTGDQAEFQFQQPESTPWQVDPVASRWQAQVGLRWGF